MKKILTILMAIIIFTSCNRAKENRYQMAENTKLSLEEKFKIYDKILMNLKFYRVKVPDKAVSYAINISKIDQNNKKIRAGGLSSNFKDMKNFSRSKFDFCVGENENFFIIGVYDSVSKIYKKASKEINRSRFLHFNDNFDKLELNKEYILMVGDYLSGDNSCHMQNAKSIDEFKGEKDHSYELITISFSDKVK